MLHFGRRRVAMSHGLDGPALTVPANGTSRPGRFRALWAPLVVIEAYLAFTVFVFFFGPVEWDVPNPLKLLGFLAVNYGALYLGYRRGIRPARARLRTGPVQSLGTIQVPRAVVVLILVSMVFSIFSSLMMLQAVRGDLAGVLMAFRNPGEAYNQSQNLAQAFRDGNIREYDISNYSWAFRISTVLSVLKRLYFPLSLACWGLLPRSLKVLFFVATFTGITSTVGAGAQSGVGFLIFAALPVALYRLYVARGPMTTARGARPARRGRGRAALVRAGLVLAFGGLVATVAYFQVSRAETGRRALDPVATLAGSFGQPAENSVFRVTGTRANYGLTMALLYMSHGYQGLALAMEQPFVWTFGFGWSGGLQAILRDYLGGPDLFQRSYLVRNQAATGWPALNWWSTIFPWVASDTTFYGTFLFTALVGFVAGRSWSTLILRGNPVGFAVLGQLFILVFMFPANNALAQTLDGLFALVGVVVIYSLSWRFRKKGATGGSIGETAVESARESLPPCTTRPT